MVPSSPTSGRIAVIGAGPAGLFCAERLAAAGHTVAIFDQMPAPARKFLLAGRGGLNLTHSEPLARFVGRYTAEAGQVADWVHQFPPAALRAWADSLGADTFVGSSGRVFPKALKASPLLRAWLQRLAGFGVELLVRHRFCGWTEDGALAFSTPTGQVTERPLATVLALGGGSWPRLGSDGRWTEILTHAGVEVEPLVAANCGVRVDWSAALRQTTAGQPVKPVAVSVGDKRVRGEVVITATGLEGGPIYALGPAIRAGLAQGGTVAISLDLAPDLTLDQLALRLTDGPGKRSWHRHLARVTGLSPAALRLLREPGPFAVEGVAQRIKALPLQVQGLSGLDRAISTAGGVRLQAIDPQMMLTAKPGVFVAGEMVSWDAPTGGYLLQACFASAAAAAAGVGAYLSQTAPGPLEQGARGDQLAAKT